MILIVIKFPVRPDRIEEFRAKADEYAAAVREGSFPGAENSASMSADDLARALEDPR